MRNSRGEVLLWTPILKFLKSRGTIGSLSRLQKVSLKTKSQVSSKNGTFPEIFESKDLESSSSILFCNDYRLFQKIKSYINERIESRSGEGGFFQSVRYNGNYAEMLIAFNFHLIISRFCNGGVVITWLQLGYTFAVGHEGQKP